MKKLRVLAALALIVMLAASCAKKAEVKPPAAYDPEEAFRKANALIEKSQYDEARRELQKIESSDTTMTYAPLARLRIADTYVLEKEPDTAVSEFRKFLELYPAHKYAPYAQYQIGMVYFNQMEDAERGQDAARKALAEFEKLNRLYPRNPYRESLAYYIEAARSTIAEHVYLVGTFYFKKGSYRAAINRYLQLLDEYPDFTGKEEVLYRISVGYARAGDPESARKYLDRLLSEYPDSELAKKAEKELAKSEAKAQKG
ncbi:MAG: outer membrane protein assembly factor BamD [Nitrospirota bacterium]|jgi:outer membrane protein assembly factor BamD